MLLPGPLRGILRGRNAPPGNATAAPVHTVRAAAPPRKAACEEPPVTRSSRGLEEFFAYIRGQSGLTILDLGGATQENVSFITNLGHRLYSEDFLQILNDTFGDDKADQSNPGRIEYFLRQTLDYPEEHFDGVLIWDVLEYLEPALLAAVVDRLRKVVRSKSYLLAFFHSDDKLEAVPIYTFRIQEVNALQVARRGTRRPAQFFNNRGLERLFGKFESVKLFLTRERLREILVKA
jgi:2-polyprenyl-3-methyl-5-hydroxy-6-metoxy-1,4-benzoquinol methylase